jgi:pantoate--beta-alanine ligase
METLSTITEMKERSACARKAGKSIGFVPTMGRLHEGHLSLVRESLATCDVTVVSIFINPLQFGENEDLDTYPIDLEGDKCLLQSAGVDFLFLPNRDTIYPPGHKTYVQVEEISQHLCGKSRPVFLRGVATIVLKLFNIVQPNSAFFGEKDWQQLAVVETLVRDLNLDISIIRLPIVREEDGLAMSSRNLYLSAQERDTARCLSRALEEAKKQVEHGEGSAGKIQARIRHTIEQYPNTRIDYVSVCNPQNLVECREITDKVLIALAVHVGDTRLIDNCIVRRTECRE